VAWIALAVSLGLAGSGAAMEPDPRLAAMLDGITADSLLAHVDTLVDFGTRRWDQPGGREAQEHIETFFAGLELDDVYLHDFDAGADNVVAVLRGSARPERLHVIGAHYDSVGDAGAAGPAPGADDNASGTAALLEAARVLAESGLRPAETILFVAFSAEEQGRRGSSAFVAELESQGANVADMICMDVIGYVHPGTEPDLSVSSSSFTPAIDALIEHFGEVAAAYLPEWRYEGGPGCG
jgi:leucyl aminopeptidase